MTARVVPVSPDLLAGAESVYEVRYGRATDQVADATLHRSIETARRVAAAHPWDGRVERWQQADDEAPIPWSARITLRTLWP